MVCPAAEKAIRPASFLPHSGLARRPVLKTCGNFDRRTGHSNPPHPKRPGRHTEQSRLLSHPRRSCRVASLPRDFAPHFPATGLHAAQVAVTAIENGRRMTTLEEVDPDFIDASPRTLLTFGWPCSTCLGGPRQPAAAFYRIQMNAAQVLPISGLDMIAKNSPIQFRLSHLFLGMFFCTVGLGIWKQMCLEATRQQEVVVMVERLGMHVGITESTFLPSSCDVYHCSRVNLVSCDWQCKNLCLLLNFPRIEFLEAAYSNASDYSCLSHLTRLKYINLKGTNIVDVSPLSELPDLEHLNLSCTNICDVTPLRKLRSLERLDLRATHVDAEQIKEIEKAIPGCAVLY
ncbi:Internalin-A precursor [Lignipirellula cremea]|uniref:Internalin-A n=2 Tax=Lignipirellula cremea TaxID=2528010 RepID=A0A518E204_9BACT|nr:Internalin-A precursor [Lignipirellula cremea]